MSIRSHEKRDGLLLVDESGKARYATFKERVLYRIFGFLPRKL